MTRNKRKILSGGPKADWIGRQHVLRFEKTYLHPLKWEIVRLVIGNGAKGLDRRRRFSWPISAILVSLCGHHSRNWV
jgi:hypothetical protein